MLHWGQCGLNYYSLKYFVVAIAILISRSIFAAPTETVWRSRELHETEGETGAEAPTFFTIL